MKQFVLSVVVVFCGLNTTNAQNRTYFGLEFSLFRDIPKIKDNGDYLMTLPVMEPLGGITVRQEIKKQIIVEAGVIVKPYSDAIGFKPIPVSFAGTEGISLMIPIRLGMNLNVYKDKIYLVPVIGYSYSANTPTGYGRDSGTQESSTTTITYTSTKNSDVSRYVSLLQMGAGFEFHIFNLLLSISTNYYKGYSPIWISDIIPLQRQGR
jgi:hypothetical protein